MSSTPLGRTGIKLVANIGVICMTYSTYRHKQQMGQEFTDKDYDENDKEFMTQHSNLVDRKDL
ncbi:hypothetical protein IMG5_087150 [Ichthyophthirius multifiliis]|uniref:Uncharacterized protein n=1 Tax=Ichthyophthirius multifiliis TaxID=5932 RepID=G0QR14_ICHMU|nr:hypothetical protein IMG5_087150 [Ichthyophthirius multifiliis]EGR32341.1 hypothetical protein IMG5_087150 [Ichthyophthirius multifiliis]|eukprot:XP_004035827.1 hypothetical protein IMG5_087150 [Ichthyophthirius multifiliis]